MTTTESGEPIWLRADTEVLEVTDLLDVAALIDGTEEHDGIERCTVTGPRKIPVTDSLGEIVEWQFWYDLDCTTTIEIWTGWTINGTTIEGQDQQEILHQVATAAGIDPDDIQFTYQIDHQPTLPGQPDGVGNPGDPQTITTTDPVTTIPYGADLLTIDATLDGFDDSICTPTIQPLKTLTIDHTAPDPNPDNIYTLTIALDCAADRQVTALRNWTVNLDQGLIDNRPADMPTIDAAEAALLLGVDAELLVDAPLVLQLRDVFGNIEQVEIEPGELIGIRADTEVLGVDDDVDELLADTTRCAASSATDRIEGGEPELSFLVWWDLTCAAQGRIAIDWLLDGDPASAAQVAAAASVSPTELQVVAEVGYTPIDAAGEEGDLVALEDITPDAIFELPLRARVDVINLEIEGLDGTCTVTSPLSTTRPDPIADDGGVATYTLPVDVDCNTPVAGDRPEVSDVHVTPSPTPIGTRVRLTATASSAQHSQITAADFTVEDADGEQVASGTMHAVDGTFDSPMEELVADLGPFDDIGVYEVCVTATDTDERSSDPGCTLLVVYDPSAGFVTGGGWFDSPAEALAANPDVTGRASFGFVARYQRNGTVPVGNTQFQFQAGGLNLHSTSYDWLLVNQGGSNAQFKGEGRLNGVDGFGFMVWATDGGRNSTDTFRIRITGPDGGLVYDNSGSELRGGSIVVHTPRGNMR